MSGGGVRGCWAERVRYTFIQIGQNIFIQDTFIQASKTVSSGNGFPPEPLFPRTPFPQDDPTPMDPPPLDRPKFRFFFLSGGGLLVELWPRVAAMDHPNCAQPQPVATIPREDPREKKKSETGAGDGKKREISGSPPLGPPALRASPPFQPPPFRGPTFSRSGPHPSGSHPFRAPTTIFWTNVWMKNVFG